MMTPGDKNSCNVYNRSAKPFNDFCLNYWKLTKGGLLPSTKVKW